MDTDKTSGDTGADGKAGDNAADAAKDTTTRTDGSDMPREINGPKGPEPTRYGDWEQKGRCSDF
ncbi:MAG: succinate dehydrogenase assembly factor 4 [Pseudomonadota bacterium]|jgi:hypothetical protein|nr:succinate dehydrogenase assembly factor 4 [Pseudomonadota bacterium]MEC7371438.1 succinate dehydrogenase assembly factor 4 [Pseudomonadota bacterium]MEC7585486.1 succinate dehydrogenase assembly factor 4 [Pseudomonadota bacterium]|tara:strand:- start:947 stop:1138 length:192 start_codon:yes stop_codon:yes gene_type:complete